MNKRKKNQKRKAVDIENNSMSYFPKSTVITTETDCQIQTNKEHFVV